MLVSGSFRIQQAQELPIFDQIATRSDPALDQLNVEQRIEYLRQQFTADAGERRTGANVQPKPGTGFGKRAIKSGIALAVAAVVVWIPVQRLLQATSVEA